MDVQIEPSWKQVLEEEFQKPYFSTIVRFLKKEKAAGKTLFPPGKLIFNAFNTTAFEQVKLIILGQDPYHNPGQAHGLSFSVPEGILPPPSLLNIYKEIQHDLGLPIPATGNLEKWARQGVLLLNASLTVEMNRPMSHSPIGWHHFTDAIIKILSDKKEHLVFLLWGSFARSKKELIDHKKHYILTAPHPSPLSAHRGFFGCKHFSKANDWFTSKGISKIDWSLS